MDIVINMEPDVIATALKVIVLLSFTGATVFIFWIHKHYKGKEE